MIEGSTLTLIPQLELSQTYTIAIPKGSILGKNKMPFDGFSDYVITTMDSAEPVLVKTVPEMNGEIGVSGVLEFHFNKDVMVTGNWTSSITCGSTVLAIPDDIPAVVESVLTIPFEIPSSMQCSLIIEEGSISDLNGNEYSEPIYLVFRIADTDRPTVALQLQPIDDLQAASRISDLIFQITDSTSVSLSGAIDGGITVRSANFTFLYTAEMLSLENNRLVIPNPTRFHAGESVSVDVPAGMIVDASGNGNERAQFSFVISTETVQPVAQSLTSNTAFDSDVLHLQFSSVITLGTGSVMLTCQGCESVISVASSALFVEDRTLNIPFSGALSGHSYLLTLEPDVVYNIFGNGNDLTVLEEMVTIYSSQKPVLLKEACSPADGAHSVPLSTTLSLVFDQAVQLTLDCQLFAFADTVYNSHNVSLVSMTSESATAQLFSVDALLPFVLYTVEVPEGCFANQYGVTNEASSLSFTTTRDMAPSVVSFNLEGQSDVLLDSVMVFTFDQDLVIAENATILVKARDQQAVQRPIHAVSGHSFTIYNTKKADRLSASTEYTVLIPDNVVCNSDNLCMAALTFNPFTTVSPSSFSVIFQHSIPTSGSVLVPADSNLTLYFSGPVRATTGSSSVVTILEESQPVEGSMVISENQVVMTFPLRSAKTYTYVFDEDAFSSLQGEPVLYDMGSSMSFTVADTEGPEYYAFEVERMLSLVLRFNENVVGGNGTLLVKNSNGEVVLPAIHANVETPRTTVMIALNAENLPDDIYEFAFGEDFVQDIYGNPNLAFVESYGYDRMPPYILSVAAPSSILGPFVLSMNEPVEVLQCEMQLIDEEQNAETISSLSLVEVDSQTFHLFPTVAWKDQTQYTLAVPAGCFVDRRNVTSVVVDSFQVQTPALASLAVNSTGCFPEKDAVVSIGLMLGSVVVIQFGTPVQYMTGKAVSLENAEGCVLADASSIVVSGSEASFLLSNNTACFTGHVTLVAEEGAFVSLTTGAQSPASNAEQQFYAFSFLPAGPVALSATAVYMQSLQVMVGSRIDVTFNKAIQAPSELSYVRFLSCQGDVVPFAEQIHGEVEGAVLKIVVDVVAQQASQASQVCAVRFLPVLPGQGVTSTVEGEDVAVGDVVLSRLFAMPQMLSSISAVGSSEGEPISVQPTLEITFNQNVVRSSDAACVALIIHDSLATRTVALQEIVTVSSTVFRWTPADTALLTPGESYSFMADNGCFMIENTNAPATGVSSMFYATVGPDTVGPVVVGVSSGEAVSATLELGATSSLFVVFNEPVQLVENSFVYLMNTEDASVVQIRSAQLVVDAANPARVEIPWRQLRLATPATYSLRLETIANDLAGNPMQSMTITCRIRTPSVPPMPVEHVELIYLQTGVGLLSFDAALDTSLESVTSLPGACHYTVTVLPLNQQIAFDDVCMGRAATGATRLASVISPIDPELSSMIKITVHNNVVNDFSTTQFSTVADPAPVPEAPAAPVLLAVEEDAVQVEVATPLTYSYSLLSYTFLAELDDQELVLVSVEASPMTSIYRIPLPTASNDTENDVARRLRVRASAIQIRVKATTAMGSSAFSQPLLVTQTDVPSTVPQPVVAESVQFLQLAADAMQLTWEPAASREAITGYEVATGATLVTVTEPSVVLRGLEDGPVLVNITAMNVVGKSEPTSVTFDFSSSISASVESVVPGASYAVATFSVSFVDSAVECAINAGRLVHGYAVADAERRATVVFTGLIASFHYSGLCWAYSLSSPAVSQSVPLSFTTQSVADEASLAVSDFVVASLGAASVRVDVDVPADVFCVLAGASEQLLHADVLASGQKAELRLDGPKTLSFTQVPAEASVRLFCTAQDTLGRRLGDLFVSAAVVVPNRVAELTYTASSVANGAADVSLRPSLQFEFDRAVQLNPDAAFVLEDMSTGAFLNLTASTQGAQLRLAIPAALEQASKYTLYSTDRPVSSLDGTAVAARFVYGAFTFTTTASTQLPALLTGPADLLGLDPAAPLSLLFDQPVFLLSVSLSASLTSTSTSSTSSAWSASLPASQIRAEGASVELEPFGLPASAELTLTLPACLLMDAAGHCLPELRVALSTGADATRPLVLETEPREGQSNIPSDLPLVLRFDEPVRLFAVDNLLLRTNGQRVPLDALSVAVEGREVRILPARGFNRGNENLPFVEVELEVGEDAFRDEAGNSNEAMTLRFTAAAQRCGSSYLSSFMEDGCKCYSEGSKCYCDCGPVDLFEL